MTHFPFRTERTGRGRGYAPTNGRTHGHVHAGLAELLDLDAAILGSYLGEATAWVASLTRDAPRLIVDLGAGTGVGALALAERFPVADVVALDRSTDMLRRIEHVAQEAASAGSAGRIRALKADVDVGWPALGPIDLVWSSSALHEVADPARVLRDIHAALRPGGLIVILELDGPTGFEFGPRAGVDAGWAARLRNAEMTLRGDAHADWRAPLADAGFEPVGERRFTAEAAPGSPVTGRYARLYLERIRPGLQDRLDPADLAVLDTLLASRSPDAPLPSGDLTVRTTRTAWAARVASTVTHPSGGPA